MGGKQQAAVIEAHGDDISSLLGLVPLDVAQSMPRVQGARVVVLQLQLGQVEALRVLELGHCFIGA